MNLQTLQTDLLNRFKYRSKALAITDVYLRRAAFNLRHPKNVISWWRKIQVQDDCLLTGTLLKKSGTFDYTLGQFIMERFSIFKEEVGISFLDFIRRNQQANVLLKSVSQFEYAVLRLKTGHSDDVVIPWPYEPFGVIESLLDNTYNENVLRPGNFEIIVSESYGPELFRVYEIVN